MIHEHRVSIALTRPQFAALVAAIRSEGIGVDVIERPGPQGVHLGHLKAWAYVDDWSRESFIAAVRRLVDEARGL